MRDGASNQTTPPQEPPFAEVQSLIKGQSSLEKTHARRAMVRRGEVFMPFVFHKSKFINFKRKHLNFLNNWRADVPLGQAALAAGLSVDQARRFLARKDVRAWLQDLSQEARIKQDWDRPEKWYAMGNEIFEGKRIVSFEQLKVWLEFGDRSVPKPSRNAPPETKSNITININPSAVDKAFERQASIDAEISKEAL